MLLRYRPLKSDHLLVSDSETESDDLEGYFNSTQVRRWNSRDIYNEEKVKENDFDEGESIKDIKAETDEVIEDAKKYQEKMKKIPIPPTHKAPIAFNTWQELGKSISESYGQPLHYLTLKILKKWDESRIGTEEETKPMHTIIPPNKAETTIWVIEEFHRLCNSHARLAKPWLSDPTYHAFVDPIITDDVESDNA
ncbi:hypothetical protein ACOSQ2_027026 [Xanthoceras sorbifolium]